MPRKKKSVTNYDSNVDANRDGKTTRSEAEASNVDISAMDLNDDGRVTRSERLAYLAAFGTRAQKAAARGKIRSKTPTKPKRKKKKTPAQIRAELRLIFDTIDSDGSGGVDQAELEEHAGLLGFGQLTCFEISELLHEADANDDGIMDFEEFCIIVESARDSASLWKNAGALETAVKRYNNVLEASDHLFTSIQAVAAASCEQDEQGRKVAGCGRIAARIAVSTMHIVCFFGLLAATGMATLQSIYSKLEGVDIGTVDPSQFAPDIFAIIMSAWIAFAVYGFAVFIITVVGFTRSQGHLGHVIFGYHVIDNESGEPVGFFGLLARIYVPIMVQLVILYLKPELVLEVTSTLYAIEYLINPIMLLVHSESRTLWDLMLGQQVVVR